MHQNAHITCLPQLVFHCLSCNQKIYYVIYKSWLLGVFNQYSTDLVNINHKIPLTEVEGSVLVEYHHVTIIHMLYTIVRGRAIIVFAVRTIFRTFLCICVLLSS